MEVINVLCMDTLGYFDHKHIKTGLELYLPSANFEAVIINMHGGDKPAHWDFGSGNSCD